MAMSGASPESDGSARSDRLIGIVGLGRAGSSFAAALEARGWTVKVLDHSAAVPSALDEMARKVDVVLLCVPDSNIADVASQFSPEVLADGVVLAHCSGAATLDVLGSASRVGSIHPLVSLSGENPGDLIGAWFALAGDSLLADVAASLDGRTVQIEDADRSLYHAGAVIASNHLVALLAQVETIAARVGMPVDAFLDLAQVSLDNCRELGARSALTGPVSRGDVATVVGHLEALERSGLHGEVDAYVALAKRAAVLAGRDPDEAVPLS
ncbi:MAG: DUF2520 domain-containing protein [Microthrixaceae bacterium]|nr:DUF2520 domain-containing protein [Microthrixaceae bacterium]